MFKSFFIIILLKATLSLPALEGELEEEIIKSLHYPGKQLVTSNLDTIKPALPDQIHSSLLSYLREANVVQRSDMVKVDNFQVTIPIEFYNTHILGVSSDQSGLILPFQSVEYKWDGTVDDLAGHRWSKKVIRLGKVELLADLNVFTKRIIVKTIRSFEPVALRADDIFQLSFGFKAKLDEHLYHTAVLGMNPQAKSIILTKTSSPIEMTLVESGIFNGKWVYKKLATPKKGHQFMEFLSKNNIDYSFVLPNGQVEEKSGKVVIGGWISKNENGETSFKVTSLQRAEK